MSSITVSNLVGTPIELVPWGATGLAVLTMNLGGNGSPGMLYLIQDIIVSATQAATSLSFQSRELVRRHWKRISKADIVKMVQAKS